MTDAIHISQLPPRFREVLDKGLRHRDQVREQTGGDADYSFAILDELEQLMAEEEAKAEQRHAFHTWQGEQDLIELRAEDMEPDDDEERERFLHDQVNNREKGKREQAYIDFLEGTAAHPDFDGDERLRAEEERLDQLWAGPYVLVVTFVAVVFWWAVRG